MQQSYLSLLKVWNTIIAGIMTIIIYNIQITAGEDYTYDGLANLQFTLNNSVSRRGIDIDFMIIDDEMPEGPENMTLHIVMTVADYNIVVENMTTITIVDDFGKKLVVIYIQLSLPNEHPINSSHHRICYCAYTSDCFDTFGR